MGFHSVLQRISKAVRRRIRYHWFIERAQYWVRRNPALRLPAIRFELDVKPGEVIVDCGANVGDITSLFARSGATVYAFEPNPLTFAILSQRFWAMPTVHCFNHGVMDRRCTLTLRTRNPHTQWDAIDLSLAASFVAGALVSEEYTVKEVEIECIDLDEFIRSLGRRVRLLKLDIEGSELMVLNHLMDSGTIELIDLIVVETHEQQMPHLLGPTDALRQRIRSGGFEPKIWLDWP